MPPLPLVSVWKQKRDNRSLRKDFFFQCTINFKVFKIISFIGYQQPACVSLCITLSKKKWI